MRKTKTYEFKRDLLLNTHPTKSRASNQGIVTEIAAMREGFIDMADDVNACIHLCSDEADMNKLVTISRLADELTTALGALVMVLTKSRGE